MRDVWAARGQSAALAAMVFLGVFLFESSWASFRGLSASYDAFYRKTHLADFTIAFYRGPRAITRQLEQIPGVRRAEGRIVRDVRFEHPHAAVPTTSGRLISLPAGRHPEVNDIWVQQGRYLQPGRRRELILEKRFAQYHGYRLGELVCVVVRGKRIPFRIVGFATSPEYLYVVRSRQYLFPAHASFGVAWIARRDSEELFGMEGEINEVCCAADRALRDRAMAIAYANLRRYGAQLPEPQEKQPSKSLLQMDLDGFAMMAVLFPALFLTCAALTAYAAMSRTVHMQRHQIGFLRASGLSAWQVALHFVHMGAVLGFPGAILGMIAGAWMAGVITRYYLRALGVDIPAIVHPWAPGAFGAALGVGTTVLASLVPAWRAARLSPAEALRPEAGATAQFEPPRWLSAALGRLPCLARLPLLNLLRQAQRTAYTAIGVAFGMALMISSVAQIDSLEATLDYYFREVRNYDLMITFERPRSANIVEVVKHWPGVRWAESAVELPVRVSRGGVSRDTVVTGLRPGSKLQKFVDVRGRPVRGEGEGVWLTRAMARSLGVEPGDLLRLDYAFNSRYLRASAPARVRGIIQQPVGNMLYASEQFIMERLGRRVGLGEGQVGGVLIKADPRLADSVKRRAYDMDGVVYVDDTQRALRQIEEMMALFYAYIGLMVMFGVGLAAAVAFNMISMNIFERRSELASLRAMGLRVREMTRLVTVENLLAVGLGVLVGLPCGYGLSRYIFLSYETEQMAMLFVISLRTYLVAVVLSLLLCLVSQLPPLREIIKMDLAAMTRERAG